MSRDHEAKIERQSPAGKRPESHHESLREESVRKIVNGSNYWPADEDLGFLQEVETRGLRLQLEYLKADTILRQHHIGNTIVVFGSTRIEERQIAERRLEESRR